MVPTIIQYVRNSAQCFPDKVAFRDQERSITFAQLDQEAQILAGMIHKKLGGAVKQAIGIYLPKSVDCIVAFLAAAYSGNYYTPLDTAMPSIRLEKIMNVLQPSVIITDYSHRKEMFSHRAIFMDKVHKDSSEKHCMDKMIHQVIDTDILYVMFTSGSTGDPKGVIISHRAVVDYIDWLADTFDFNENTIFGNQAPFFFDNSVLDIYSTLRNGCEMVIIPNEMFLSGERLCTFMNENRINTIFWVPSAMSLVANSHALEKVPMRQLTKILFAGEVMPTKQLNIWRNFLPDALYANLYGPTEIAVDCTYYIVDRDFDDEESLPIGRACTNTEILVLDEKDRLAEPGMVGELCVRGSCLAYGYYGNPQKTQESFVQNPLNDKYSEKIYRTGDLVRYNERGELMFVGRKDSQIKHRGYRIELGEIETAVSSVKEIGSCCALYDNDKKQIVLFVTPEIVNKKVLYSHIKTLLPSYMLPGKIVTESLLPLNQNGKIDRLALRKKLKEEL